MYCILFIVSDSIFTMRLHVLVLLLSLCGCIGEPATTTTTTSTTQPTFEHVTCGEHHYQYRSGECCLDANDNRVCDSHETVVTVSTSTTVKTTSTTTPKIACAVSSDCGERREQRVCVNGDVYLQRIQPVCRNPGTPQAECIEKATLVGQTMRTQPKPIDVCVKSCKMGVCT